MNGVEQNDHQGSELLFVEKSVGKKFIYGGTE